MRKLIAIVAALGLLALPGSVQAAGGNGQQGKSKANGRGQAIKVARQQCNAERQTLGVKAFRDKYGRPNAYRNCVQARLAADRAAAANCRAERKQLGPKAFRQKYGKRNTLDQCIKVSAGG